MYTTRKKECSAVWCEWRLTLKKTGPNANAGYRSVSDLENNVNKSNNEDDKNRTLHL